MKLKKFLSVEKIGMVCSLFFIITFASLISSCKKDSAAPVPTSTQPATVEKSSPDELSQTTAPATVTTPAPSAAATSTPATSAVATTGLTYKESAPISYTGVNNITISGVSITAGSVPAITLNNCINVHITLSRFVNGTNVNAVGIYLYKCTNVTIDYCYFNKVASGVYASTSTGIYVTGNQMLNMMGPMPRGQFVQLNACYGAGNKIMGNKFENIMGSSNPEDAINIFESNGVAESPITVSNNWIRGGGPSKSGGGIALGDGGGSYQVASDNILVNPGQYGIAIAAGNVMSILNNKIYAAQASYTNVGTFAWNQYASTSGCSIVSISGNEVNFTAAGGYQNSNWDGGNCGTINGWKSNIWASNNITPAILPATIITMK
ncbi:NosD domain-containing protein [Mucilaginibacter panaciglaebae]|uniref:Parallel beta helix pectate lyase-like protein n=1 Tax=Mucilaginibacter panaciglaebae TaxID=502331 RepID=A0ABP7WJ83_9SPHI